MTEERAAESPWLTPEEAARYLKVHVTTLYAWARAGRVRRYTLAGGTTARYRREELDALMQPQGAPR
jgi:excisionase family DNA binding protein